MTTFAITMCKDEADIVQETVSRMLEQVDAVIVADNGSTDGTLEILEGLPIDLRHDPEVGYYQSAKMTALAADAAEKGAHWIVPFDADEVWTSPHGRIADVLAERPETLAPAPILNYVATALDDEQLSPVARLRWRQAEPLGLPKVACRARLPVTIEQGNHTAHYPSGLAEDLLEVRHFPYRSEEQFLSKVRNGSAVYKASNLPVDTGAHWRQYGDLLDNEGPDAVRGWFRNNFFLEDPEGDPRFVLDPCP